MKQPPSNLGDNPPGNPESTAAFRAALERDYPPPSWSEPFRALWWDARGDWEAAHEIAQELPTSWGSWMHAYLHRKEGDLWNAGYWYRRAGVGERRDSLNEEFDTLLRALLDAERKTV
ncbi:MAG: hypothetical protein ACO20F_01405 [Robiginitalea sp.]|jgi:hypothetical protein